MKASMDKNGCIIITPQSGMEAFALQQWIAKNQHNVPSGDVRNPQTPYWRASGLMVSAEVPTPAQQTDAPKAPPPAPIPQVSRG